MNTDITLSSRQLPNYPIERNQGGACGAAGPASAPGSAVERPARHTPGHTRQAGKSTSAHATQTGTARSRLLAPDCPARSHCVKGGPAGRRFVQTLDPAAAPKGSGACEQDGAD